MYEYWSFGLVIVVIMAMFILLYINILDFILIYKLYCDGCFMRHASRCVSAAFTALATLNMPVLRRQHIEALEQPMQHE